MDLFLLMDCANAQFWFSLYLVGAMAVACASGSADIQGRKKWACRSPERARVTGAAAWKLGNAGLRRPRILSPVGGHDGDPPGRGQPGVPGNGPGEADPGCQGEVIGFTRRGHTLAIAAGGSRSRPVVAWAQAEHDQASHAPFWRNRTFP